MPAYRSTGPLPRLLALIEGRRGTQLITLLILANAVIIGLQTDATLMASSAGPVLLILDRAILALFVVELLIRIAGHGRRFFASGWNLFDFFVVAVSLAPTVEGLAVLRALRVLRVLRLVSVFPQMRKVVHALLNAIPGMGTVAALLALVFYVAGVIATNLYSAAFPDWFGSLGRSLYTLFQIMTLESWSMGIVRPVMAVDPLAWIFFVGFILVTSFAVLNLFIAIIVDSMQAAHEAERADELAAIRAAAAEGVAEEDRELLARIDDLSAQIASLKAALEGRRPPPD